MKNSGNNSNVMLVIKKTLTKTDQAFIVTALLICLTVALTQAVNPFLIDGWFDTQNKLFGKFTGEDNFTPIAFPALFYFLIHKIAVFLKFNLEKEFYLAAVLQNFLLFVSSVLIYFSSKLLRQEKIGFFLTLGMLIYLESLLIAQAFFSELFSVFLNSIIVFIIVKLSKNQNTHLRQFYFLTIILGVCLGFIIITRVIPIIYLFGIFIFFNFLSLKKNLKYRRFLCPMIATSLVFLMLIVAMALNHYRFGRFELTNSTGRHLWQGVKDIANTVLKNDENYILLKVHIPDIQGKSWHDFNVHKVPELKDQKISHEYFLKQLSVKAILSHPFTYLQHGINKFRSTFRLPLPQIGLYIPSNSLVDNKIVNPLRRNKISWEDRLSPLVPVFFSYMDIFNSKDPLYRIYKYSSQLYPYIVSVVAVLSLTITIIFMFLKFVPIKVSVFSNYKYLSLAVFQFSIVIVGYFFHLSLIEILIYTILNFVGNLILSNFYSSKFILKRYKSCDKNLHILILILLSYFYIGSIYLSYQIEVAITRYAIPYAPLLALMSTICAKIVFEFPIYFLTINPDRRKSLSKMRFIAMEKKKLFV